MLHRKLLRSIHSGDLSVGYVGGPRHRFHGHSDGPRVVVRLDRPATAWRLFLHPDLFLGEAYVDGALVIEEGNVADLLEIVGRNLPFEPAGTFAARAAQAALRRLQQANPRGAARRNVAHHYDISGDIYRMFLDSDLQYSCAYFEDARASLEQAQAAKKRHIAEKLLLAPGQRVLDIGCGWGGLALHLARTYDVDVMGISLSREQLDVCKARARTEGLSHRVRFEYRDYRDLRGHYDRIVSVGMLEHVGAPGYGRYFDAIRQHLAWDGVALVHSIGRAHGPSYTSSWIRKYIFPGGYVPALSEVMPSIERSGLWLTDLEILRLHYAETLRLWRERFLAASAAAMPPVDQRFRRMWEFYLAASEMSFRYHGLMVFQAQLSRQVGTVPSTRDYLYATPAPRLVTPQTAPPPSVAPAPPSPDRQSA